MKSITIFVVCISFMLSANAVKPSTPGFYKIDSKTFFINIGDNGNKISLYEFAHSTKKELQEKTGRKMNFIESLSIKAVQKKLKKRMDVDGKMSVSQKDPDDGINGKTGFHIGGFALGLLLSWIGVIIAYLIRDEKKKNRVKWAWIGFGVYVLLIIALVAIAVSGFRIP